MEEICDPDPPPPPHTHTHNNNNNNNKNDDDDDDQILVVLTMIFVIMSGLQCAACSRKSILIFPTVIAINTKVNPTKAIL